MRPEHPAAERVDADLREHPLVQAIGPLLERIGADLVPPGGRRAGDVPLTWDGEVIAAVRLPEPAGQPEAVGDLSLLLQDVAGELGGDLAVLPRAQKQRAVRLLEERGAFAYRKSAEEIATALGVSRFTVYNYLNRGRDS